MAASGCPPADCCQIHHLYTRRRQTTLLEESTMSSLKWQSATKVSIPSCCGPRLIQFPVLDLLILQQLAALSLLLFLWLECDLCQCCKQVPVQILSLDNAWNAVTPVGHVSGPGTERTKGKAEEWADKMQVQQNRAVRSALDVSFLYPSVHLVKSKEDIILVLHKRLYYAVLFYPIPCTRL